MKVLFVGRWDWANLCNRIARALNAFTGTRDVRVVTEKAHPFGYVEDMIVDTGQYDDLPSAAQSADWLVSTGDGDYEFLAECKRTLPLRADVKLAVTHAGSAFRRSPAYYNDLDNRTGVRVRFIGADSLRFATNDPRARVYFGTSDPVDQLPALQQPIVVTHSPTIRANKGTDIILPVLERLQTSGVIVVDLMEKLPPVEVMRRRGLAHVHVDQMSEVVGGFGQSAIEAMGTGNVVLADLRHVGPLNVARPPIIDVRSAQELEKWLLRLAQEPSLLHRHRQEALAWSQQHSAPAAVAKYWLDTLNTS